MTSKKSEHDEPTPKPEERINDPPEGLARLREALKHILKVPKEAIGKEQKEATTGGHPSPHPR